MISIFRRGRLKLNPWPRPGSGVAQRAVEVQSTLPAAAPPRTQTMPSPAIRWVADGRIAVRSLIFDADAEAVCGFQEETYSLNFPHFRYTPAFAEAFRYDLRRAALDPLNGVFVLDDGRQSKSQTANIAGFLWVVICQNNWSGDRYGYINNLYVAPARRGQGLGKELMKQADEFFRSRGIKRVRLTVTAANEAAAALYRSSGYAVDRWEMQKEI